MIIKQHHLNDAKRMVVSCRDNLKSWRPATVAERDTKNKTMQMLHLISGILDAAEYEPIIKDGKPTTRKEGCHPILKQSQAKINRLR